MTPITELSQNSERGSSRKPLPNILTALGLLLATLAVYAPVGRFGFVNFDDTVYVIDNPHLRDGLTLATLKWVFFSFQPDNWFPLTRLSHLLDYTLFGGQAGYHHIVSLLIHAAASVMLFAFLRRATAGIWTAGVCAFTAFLFALHPLHVESVAWVSERKDVLCAFFWFAALWAWAGWVLRPSRGRYLLALGLFGLGLMSKPMIVTLPGILLLLDLWPFRRAGGERFPARLFTEKIPFFALSLGCAALTWLAQSRGGALRSLAAYSFGMRVENALITPWIYIFKTVWPAGLSPIYSWPAAFPLWQAVAGGIGLLAVSAAVILSRRDRPWLAVGWFWFLLTLAPVIGLIQVGEQVRADRYMYVPMTGLGLMIAGWAAAFIASGPLVRRGIAVAACLVIAAFGVLSRIQLQYWRDSETLFGHAVAVDPANYSAWFFLGNTLSGVPGQTTAAIAAYDAALRVKPEFIEAREKLARSLCGTGRDVEGFIEFAKVLRKEPHDLSANFDMGNALVRTGRLSAAIPYFREAVRVAPDYAAARINLGVSLERTAPDGDSGPLREAVALLQSAVRLEPANPLAHCDLGDALSRIPSRSLAARQHFEDALTIEPEYAAAHLGLGRVLVRRSETRADGIAHLEKAYRLEPAPDLRRELDLLEQSTGSRYNGPQ